MKEFVISAGIGALLVIFEAVGNLVSKWVIGRRLGEEEGYIEAAKIAAAGTSLDPADLALRIRSAIAQAKSRALAKALAALVPGPEAAFLALTVDVSLFLAFNYAKPEVRAGIAPLLAASQNAFPLVFGAFLVSAISWAGLTMWREAITSDLQKRLRLPSMLTIAMLGGGNLAVTIYFLITDRGIG